MQYPPPNKKQKLSANDASKKNKKNFKTNTASSTKKIEEVKKRSRKPLFKAARKQLEWT